MEAIELYRAASAEFGGRIEQVGDDQWSLPTPCTEWNVRTLVNHVITNYVMVSTKMAVPSTVGPGKRPDSIDRLGEDPVEAWRRAHAGANAALAAPDALDGEAPFPYGSGEVFPLGFLLQMLSIDTAVHAWDLATATGTDDRLDHPLVAATHPMIEAAVNGLFTEGSFPRLFAPPIDVEPTADLQTRLLGLLGRAREARQGSV